MQHLILRWPNKILNRETNSRDWKRVVIAICDPWLILNNSNWHLTLIIGSRFLDDVNTFGLDHDNRRTRCQVSSLKVYFCFIQKVSSVSNLQPFLESAINRPIVQLISTRASQSRVLVSLFKSIKTFSYCCPNPCQPWLICAKTSWWQKRAGLVRTCQQPGTQTGKHLKLLALGVETSRRAADTRRTRHWVADIQ